ncbi:MAG: hypothetical protein OEV86_16030 [Candidatus Krumholzibacteria bacterium]|nr:hypothetical protein [Candidatus Krumholzibacteria bacterium]
MSNTKIWDALSTPPAWALKEIMGGRLKGMTDVSPLWRVQAMTELFGPCGIGWKWEIVRLWVDEGADAQRFAFAHVNLFTSAAMGEGWSAPIPGVGGSMLVEKETKGLHSNDEAFKMAVTDALSTAMKMLGVAAKVYAGQMDGGKYAQATPVHTPTPARKLPPPTQDENSEPIPVHVTNVTWEMFTPHGKTEQMKRYIITFDDGATYKIIKEEMATMAAQAKVHNRPVFYSTEQRGKYTNLVAMEYAPEPLGQTEEPTDLPPVPNDDDLPF